MLTEQEARAIPHRRVSTGHLLLGLAKEGEGVAALTLAGLGVTYEAARDVLLACMPADPDGGFGHLPFTPGCKRRLEVALREALELSHNYIGTEHLLLALAREGEDCTAKTVLAQLGHGPLAVREAVLERLNGYDRGGETPPRPVAVLTREPPLSAFIEAAKELTRKLGDLDEYIQQKADEIAEREIGAARVRFEGKTAELRELLRVRDQQADELTRLTVALGVLSSTWQGQADRIIHPGEVAKTLRACARTLDEAVTHAGQG